MSAKRAAANCLPEVNYIITCLRSIVTVGVYGATYVYVAVTVRNGTLFLSIFCHFFEVNTAVTLLADFMESSNLVQNNFNLSRSCILTFGF